MIGVPARADSGAQTGVGVRGEPGAEALTDGKGGALNGTMKGLMVPIELVIQVQTGIEALVEAEVQTGGGRGAMTDRLSGAWEGVVRDHEIRVKVDIAALAQTDVEVEVLITLPAVGILVTEISLERTVGIEHVNAECGVAVQAEFDPTAVMEVLIAVEKELTGVDAEVEVLAWKERL